MGRRSSVPQQRNAERKPYQRTSFNKDVTSINPSTLPPAIAIEQNTVKCTAAEFVRLSWGYPLPAYSAGVLSLFCKWKNMEMKNLFGRKSTFYAPSGPVEYLIAGLGNPGREYENTRHNAGFMAIDYMAKEWGFSVDRLKFKSLCGDCMVAGKRVLFLKPSTFMNLSGQAVTDAAAFYKISWERVIVLSDEISLEPGKLRIRRKGSDGGHNGLKNSIYLSGSDQFPRIRIGVGQKPNPEYDLAAWVLSRFQPEELKALQGAFPKVAEAVELIVQGKIDQAMNQFN